MKLEVKPDGTIILDGRGITTIIPEKEADYTVKNNLVNPEILEIVGYPKDKVEVLGITVSNIKAGIVVDLKTL